MRMVKIPFRFVALLSLCILSSRLRAQQHSADCWLENLSPYRTQTDFRGTQPSVSDLHSFMQSLAVQYTIPIEIISGIVFQESQVIQYDAAPGAQGFLIHNLNECRQAFQTGFIDGSSLPPPPGLGLMQLTSITATDPSIPNHDPVQQITNWRYNFEAGAQVLLQKYAVAAANAPACVRTLLENPESRKVLENWFYAVQFYNGGPAASQYRDFIYDHVLHPAERITGLFPPVTITRPETAIPGFSAGQSFHADANGTWTDANCGTHVNGASSVHLSSSFAKPHAHQFANISTRLSIGTGDNVLIGGFIITGQQSKKVIVRAIGPSLGVSGSVADPVLELHDSTGATILANDDWGSASNQPDIVASTIPPGNSKESAILMTLAPGAYSAIVRGVGGTTGIGLVEVYDLNRNASARLANISTRGLVQTGDNAMIGGLIVTGESSQKTLLRGIGPSLPIPGALANPTMELRDGNGALIAANDDWKATQQTEIEATMLAPTNDAESAILTTLATGSYTAILRGAQSSTGGRVSGSIRAGLTACGEHLDLAADEPLGGRE